MVLAFFSLPAFGENTHPPATNKDITIEVTNGTPNGTAVTDDRVTLYIYEHNKLKQTLDANATAEGKVVFKNLSVGVHAVAMATAKHQDVMFSGRSVGLRAEENKVALGVEVYDVSTDKSKLSVSMHHYIIKLQSDSLAVTEYLQINNSSEMAISSDTKDSRDKSVVLEMNLPAGFKDLTAVSYFDQDALVVTDEGFYDTMAIAPGQYHASFSYTLEISSSTIDIAKKLSLPTSSFVIFAELGQARLEGLSGASQATGAGGSPIEYYKYSNLEPGREIAFKISGFNVTKSDSLTWPILIIAIGAVLLLAIVRSLAGKK